MDRVLLFKKQVEILEKLFPNNWFHNKSNKGHPAYVRWEFCKKIINQNGVIKFPEQEDKIPLIAKVIQDSTNLITISNGNIQELDLGIFNLFNDKEIFKKVTSRVVKPNMFEDIMVELYYGAAQMARSYDVTFLEIENFPDMKINSSDFTIPVFAECKRIISDSYNRLNTEIKDSNRKIKSVNEPCFGLAVFDVTVPVPIRQVNNDKLPKRLENIINTTRRLLTGRKNRSISAVIFIWEDYLKLDSKINKIGYGFRRHSFMLKHSSQDVRVEIPENLLLLDEKTVYFSISLKPRKLLIPRSGIIIPKRII